MNKWIHAFDKGIRIKWNTNSFIQDLNSYGDSRYTKGASKIYK